MNVICEYCDGNGIVNQQYEYVGSSSYLADWDDCPVCDGQGVVEVSANGELV